MPAISLALITESAEETTLIAANRDVTIGPILVLAWLSGTACDTMPEVANAAKLLARMRRNPRDWRIEDLRVVAESLGIDYDQHGTSHVMFRHRRGGRLSVPARRPIKPVYVRLFVDLIDRAGEHEDQ